MKKLYFLLLGFALLVATAVPMRAQDGGLDGDGCDDSPENPTVILAVVGSAGAFLASARARINSRRNSQ
jgi:XrtJ-associated TM-motif-TM protein